MDREAVLTPIQAVEFLGLKDRRQLDLLVRRGIIPYVEGIAKDRRYLRSGLIQALRELERWHGRDEMRPEQ